MLVAEQDLRRLGRHAFCPVGPSAQTADFVERRPLEALVGVWPADGNDVLAKARRQRRHLDCTAADLAQQCRARRADAATQFDDLTEAHAGGGQAQRQRDCEPGAYGFARLLLLLDAETTGIVIADGQSNNLFLDVAELDHVYGNVALRKCFLSVQTASRDVYMNAHCIIADEPDDPGVSCLLFSTADAFDTRAKARNRIESYLIQGSVYQGQLFGDHIAGQMTVALSQREGTAAPLVGETLLLRKNEGLGSQVEQYVRVIDVASEVRTFADDQGDFKRQIVTVSTSAQLSADFKGFAALRRDSAIDYTGKTKVYDTNVADASRYFGIKPLLAAVAAGDRTVQAEGIFVPLVPSSRTEVGIADARLNQQSAALVAGADGEVTLTANVVFTSASALSIGGFMPGTLSADFGATELTDDGGRLMNGSTSVGLVDYANGLLYLSTDLFGTGSISASIRFSPAAAAPIVSESIGVPVTDSTRRLTWVMTLNPPPAPGSLQVSYRAQGRWYALQEDGSGAIRGGDSSFGAGMLNFSTNTVNLTLGALPDVPSAVIFSWAPSVAAEQSQPLGVSTLPAAYGAILPVTPMPADVRAISGFYVGDAIVPGSLVMTWDGRTASDSTGVLAGDAKGAIAYEQGYIRFGPNVLPAKGTVVTVNFTKANSVIDEVVTAFTDAGATYTGSLGGPIKPKSLAMTLNVRFPVRRFPGLDALIDWPNTTLRDDGAGNLLYGSQPVGTINYTNGDFAIQKSFSTVSIQEVFTEVSIDGTPTGPKRVAVTGRAERTITVSVLNGPGDAAKASYSSTDAGPVTATHELNTLTIQSQVSAGTEVGAGVSFNFGGRRMTVDDTGTVYERAALGAGGAVARGTLNKTAATVSLSSWVTGLTNAVTNWSATRTRSAGNDVDAVTFRTAAAPVAPQGFSVVGELPNGGGPFIANADEDGFINGSGVVGVIDYETGIGELRFGAPTVLPPETAGVFDVSYLGVPGVTRILAHAVPADSLRYNAVSFSYLPLEADILGLDPVRLPSDGRVPIFRRGSVVVVHHTASMAPATVTNGQTINLGRPKVGQVRLRGADGSVIPAGYTVNRLAGQVGIVNVTGWPQPITIEHRIEEAALLADVQISGLLRLNKPLSRAYPSGSKISSALLLGNVVSRVSLLFDQATWSVATPVWSDDLIGGAAGPSYDAINYPVIVENDGAVTERWALAFTNSTTFIIIGEHFGQIGVGNTADDCAPINPATGTPYFRFDRRGFGSGWPAGSAIRINTVGALPPIWAARIVQQGEPVVQSDRFTIAARGGVDTP